MAFVIDRFEGEFALCESPDGEIVALPRTTLPQEAKEGDILKEDGMGGYMPDVDATPARRSVMRSRIDQLFSKE